MAEKLVRIDIKTGQCLLDQEIMKDGFDRKTVFFDAAHKISPRAAAAVCMLPL
jgi:hypothetical protein